jgi:hypothetical protein
LWWWTAGRGLRPRRDLRGCCERSSKQACTSDAKVCWSCVRTNAGQRAALAGSGWASKALVDPQRGVCRAIEQRVLGRFRGAGGALSAVGDAGGAGGGRIKRTAPATTPRSEGAARSSRRRAARRKSSRGPRAAAKLSRRPTQASSGTRGRSAARTSGRRRAQGRGGCALCQWKGAAGLGCSGCNPKP